nr:ribosomal RNA small subunit methyltransferase E isoform X1 [Ipomoea batatas]
MQHSRMAPSDLCPAVQNALRNCQIGNHKPSQPSLGSEISAQQWEQHCCSDVLVDSTGKSELNFGDFSLRLIESEFLVDSAVHLLPNASPSSESQPRLFTEPVHGLKNPAFDHSHLRPHQITQTSLAVASLASTPEIPPFFPVHGFQFRRVELFNGKGSLVEGCIQEIDQSGLNFVALENPKLVSPLDTQWHVFAAFGTLKGGRADWLVEKCTELGANSITPLLTERSPSISENRVERLLRVSLAAAKQCQRLHEMSLNPPMKVSELIPHVTKSTLSFIALAEAMPVFSALSSRRKESSGLLIIGPEGAFGNLICGGERECDPADFTEVEKNMIVDAGATAVGLGPHRLRVETATVALLATLMLWSDHQRLANS